MTDNMDLFDKVPSSPEIEELYRNLKWLLTSTKNGAASYAKPEVLEKYFDVKPLHIALHKPRMVDVLQFAIGLIGIRDNNRAKFVLEPKDPHDPIVFMAALKLHLVKEALEEKSAVKSRSHTDDPAESMKNISRSLEGFSVPEIIIGLDATRKLNGIFVDVGKSHPACKILSELAAGKKSISAEKQWDTRIKEGKSAQADSPSL